MNYKETILIVDDTLSNIDVLVQILSNYDLVVATSGKEALNILDEDEKIDLILLDIMMPEMDGFEVCKRVKKQDVHKDIPIIFLTAKVDDASIEEAFKIGAVDYITKPFRTIELTSRIKTHLKIVRHEKKIIESNKNLAIGDLIHNITHQWRQPLSAISTASSAILLEKELDILEDKELIEYCNKITTNTQYLSSILDDISTIIENTQETSQINIQKLFELKFLFFFGDTEKKKIKVDLKIETSEVLLGDKNKFIQILLAIINNAKEELLEKGHNKKALFLKITNDAKYITINIWDNAGGIKTDIIDRIFEPYFTTKHKSQGKGLGLYFVKKILEDVFYGSINVSNKEFEYEKIKYKGAEFEISFPLK